MRRLAVVVGVLAMVSGCSLESEPPPARVDALQAPDGFQVDVFAEVPNARSMVLSPGGTLFVGTRSGGTVYAVTDVDGDHRADAVHVIDEGLQMPNGVAFLDGSLYVAEVSRILRYDNIESNLETPPEPEVVVNDLPTETHHGWKYIAFGPDGLLYVPVGAPCNICDEGDPFATILRMKPDGSEREVVARGVRNTVGFDWHPETGDLWFTDNGRDHLGDDTPPCELNHLTELGQHFGYPHFHGRAVADPEFGDGQVASDFVAPAQELGPHVAPLGMEFYEGDQFPDEWQGTAFIAEHGSWNRSQKIGYRVTAVQFDADGNAVSYQPFVTGWLEGQDNWGRPVDLEHLPDGSLLLSDDQSGTIYRIRYTG